MPWTPLVLVLAIASLGGCFQAHAEDGSPRPVKLGQPLPGLSPEQLAQFERGKAKFSRPFTPQTGLGPLFNDNNCRACHFQGASGGPSERPVRLAGAMLHGGPSLLEHKGGPMIQDFAVAGTAIDQVPKETTALTTRTSPQVWGLGLVEAIPEADLLAQMAPDPDKLRLGVRGIANWDQGRIGRFGAKAQKSTLKIFTEQALDWEMGIVTRDRGTEQSPNGPPKRKPAEISQEELMDLVAYQRYLAPPPRGEASWASRRGEKHFVGVGCAECHTPMHHTGPNDIGIPEGLPVAAYSDFLLHVMDEACADHMVQGASTGQMFRTPPLWGLRVRTRYFHDGRTEDLEDAILLHGGEAAQIKVRYQGLQDFEKEELIAFLKSL